ncbi:hypothetical protein ILUMI_24092 [Ignelater luminosus]|uniref:UDP-glucuronosyltransferase n=1 Tax=Ignelater luminosus TaxID=2038154 RepID=A0A8K0G1B5_IGNLU|nr:hypothetical protein ILUMI_24092 [Ignelater luminosus]
MKVILVGLLFVSFLQISQSYRILGLFPVQGKSHIVMFEKLMKELAKRGHEVDVLSHFPQKKPIPRYNDISVRGSLPLLVNNMSISVVKEHLTGYYDVVKFILTQVGIDICEVILNTPAAQELKNSKKKYDLVVTEIFGSDCMVGFGYHFKAPVVGMISSVILPWGGDRIGNPDNPSYIPNYLVPYLSKMSLSERLINTVILLAAKLSYNWVSHPQSTAIARKFFGPDLPDLQDLVQNTSLILVNSHFSINTARPAVPNFIEVGGLHIDPPKALPKHLQEAIDIDKSQYKGVIYLSTGSMVLTETFPSYKLQAFFDAFKELPYKVLWKADREKMPKDVNIPSNIHFEPWLPQVDILCHPNVKLFVSHGGLMGTQEAIYCGIPRLGIPLFADQLLNLKASEAMGLAISVDYNEITKENVLNAAKTLLEDPK